MTRMRCARVLLATRIYAPEQAAAAFRLEALVRALESQNAQVTVLTTRSNRSGDRTVPSIRRWPVLRDPTGSVRGYLPYLSFDLPLALRILVAPRPDVVVVEPPPTTAAVVRAVLAVRAMLVNQGCRTPYVYYAADVWSDASAATGMPRAAVRALRRLERFALAGATDVIAVSEGVAARVRALGACSVRTVPNGVDTQVFRPDAVDPDGQRPEGVPHVPFLLYAGTASEWQGAEIFAEAMREVIRHHPTARLVYLGRGSAWPRLQQIAAQLPPGAIDIRPLVTPPVLAAWHRAASAALASVRPGLDYDFAYPTKVLTALACGTPVVFAGPGPAATDLSTHDLGVPVRYDGAAVAAAMVHALDTATPETDVTRRVRWVTENRSIETSAASAARVVLDTVEGPRDRVERAHRCMRRSPPRP